MSIRPIGNVRCPDSYHELLRSNLALSQLIQSLLHTLQSLPSLMRMRLQPPITQPQRKHPARRVGKPLAKLASLVRHPGIRLQDLDTLVRGAVVAAGQENGHPRPLTPLGLLSPGLVNGGGHGAGDDSVKGAWHGDTVYSMRGASVGDAGLGEGLLDALDETLRFGVRPVVDQGVAFLGTEATADKFAVGAADGDDRVDACCCGELDGVGTDGAGCSVDEQGGRLIDGLLPRSRKFEVVEQGEACCEGC